MVQANRRWFTIQSIGKAIPCPENTRCGRRPNIKKVCNWGRLRSSAVSLRKEPYNLPCETKLLIMEHRKIFNCKWRKVGYNCIPKKIFFGTLDELEVFLRAWYRENVWDKNKERLRLKREMEAGKETPLQNYKTVNEKDGKK